MKRSFPHPMTTHGTRSAHQQRGAALVVGLIFLLITSLMAITAMSGVVMQERMAGNQRNISLALSGAESAVRAGEVYLRNLISRGEEVVGDCVGGAPHRVFDRDNAGCTVAQIRTVNDFRQQRDGGGLAAGGLVHEYPASLISEAALSDPDGAGMAARPSFLVEHMGVLTAGDGQEWDASGDYSGSPPRVYRITGRGSGSSAAVVRVVESQFAAITGGGAGDVCPDGVTPLPPDPDDCP